jgi:hypothetical protein
MRKAEQKHLKRTKRETQRGRGEKGRKKFKI